MRSIYMIVCYFVVMLAHAQTCQYLAYDGMGDSSNTPLNGTFGGTGWGAPWEVQNGITTVPGYQYNTNSLTYSDLRTFGNAITGGSNYAAAGRLLNVSSSGPFGSFLNANGRIGLSGTTLWMSFMLRKEQNNDQPVLISLHQNQIAWFYTGNRVFEVGYFGTAVSDTLGVRYWTLRLGNTFHRTDVPVVVGQAAFLVAKIEFGSPHQISLFVNPSTLGSSTPTPTLVRTYSGTFDIRSVGVYLGSTHSNGSLDEIRFANSYQCVAPDAATSVNTPPTARITASPSDGTRPLGVSLSGATSSDPEGPISTYNWNFGDGTTATGVLVSKTFEHLGQNVVTLTVTDAGGLQHTSYQTITVRDANAQYPCLSSLTMLRQASCGQNNGSFRINWSNGENFTLRNSNNTVINPSSGSTYSNLVAGTYQLSLSSTAGCVSSYQLTIATDSTTCAGWKPPVCAMKIGMGISGISYWERERAFKDLMRFSGGRMITFNASGSSPWDTNLFDSIAVDAQGYPLQIPQNVAGNAPQAVRLMVGADGHLPTGDYVLLYEGVGTLTMHGDIRLRPGTTPQAGRIEVQVTGPSNAWLQLMQSQSGNHLRNVRLVRQSDETTYQTQPFYGKFLERLQPFAAVRFMDWGRTNDSPAVQWANRTPANYRTQAVPTGVAYEHIIALGNTLQKDIWVCVPHQASDDYIRQMARLFRDNLHPALNIYLEYSNEVWNWQFQQAHWVANNGPQHVSTPRRYALRATNVFRIWHEEFGVQASRVKRVLGTQAANPWVGEQMMTYIGQNEFDFLSNTWYFNYTASQLTASSTPVDVINSARNTWRGMVNSIRTDYLNASLLGKAVINYEGGQHMTNNPDIMPFQAANYAAQIHPDMYQLYQEVIDSTRRMGSKLAMAFIYASMRESRYGSWGHLEDIDQDIAQTPAPKWQALMDNIHATCGSKLCEPQLVLPYLIRAQPSQEIVRQSNIRIESTEKIQSNALMHYRSAGSIELKAGFEVNAGAVFKTSLQGCQ